MRTNLWMAGAASLLSLTATTAIAQDDAPVQPDITATAPEPAMPSTTPPPATPATEAAPVSVTTDASQTVAANVMAADGLSTLESAVVAAELGETLGGAGPFTVFAPTNDAFYRVPADALQALLQPANKAQLQSVLQTHVVAGRVTAADLAQQIDAGGGTATIRTVNGQSLTATREGDRILITGGMNTRAYVTQADGAASNGVIHVVNGVLLPAG
jgi:uncharacterized surface protein with fasciclin (FAS1) repeats